MAQNNWKQARVLEWLESNPGAHLCSEIADAIGEEAHLLGATLCKMGRAGRIKILRRVDVHGIRENHRFMLPNAPEPEEVFVPTIEGARFIPCRHTQPAMLPPTGPRGRCSSEWAS